VSEPFRQRLAFRAFWAVQAISLALPESLGVPIFETTAKAAYATMPRLRAVVAANQGQVLGREPEDPLVRAATREAFVRYGRYWYEAFHAVALGHDEVLRRFHCEGRSHMDDAIAAGTGVILALPHMGNWDVAGRWVQSVRIPIVSVAERLQPERLFRLFENHRRALGMEILPLDSGSGTGRALAQSLKENKAVALVADRDLAGSGIEVEMFGKLRRMPAGPAALALRTGAPLVPCAVYSQPGGWRCVMRDPIEVRPTGDRRADLTTITQALAVEFEALISVDPPDWHVFQPGWA
jgi:phosphatidylinositol dimannoside acyltransferase